MLQKLIKSEVQNFIYSHENCDLADLMLHQSRYPALPVKEVAEQIKSRQKVKIKIPDWFKTKGMIFPSSLSVEQASSQSTANYRRRLIPRVKNVLDLCGGMGVDSYFYSKSANEVTYIEPDAALVASARHNFHLLGAHNIDLVQDTAEHFIHHTNNNYDLIYMDPSRRQGKKKIRNLEYYFPDVLKLLPALLDRAQHILIKTSPLLDLHRACHQLTCVDEIIVLGVKNEVREVLFHCTGAGKDDPVIRAVNIEGRKKIEFRFRLSEERNESFHIGGVGKYLYEPYASVLKAGAFKKVGNQFGMLKVNPNTHLYSHDTLVNEFPGRKFKVIVNVSPLKKHLMPYCKDGKAHLKVRNFPSTVDEFRKRLSIKEGGHIYIFLAKDHKDNPRALVCEKV